MKKLFFGILFTWIWLHGVDKRAKMNYYQNAYDSAQVNDIKEYTQQTLGNIIDQMSTVVIGGIAIAVHHCCINHRTYSFECYYQRICLRLLLCEVWD